MVLDPIRAVGFVRRQRSRAEFWTVRALKVVGRRYDEEGIVSDTVRIIGIVRF